VTDAPAARMTWDKVIPIACSVAGLAVVLAGVVRVDGSRDQQLAENTRRIDAVEADVRDVKVRLYTIDGRTIRIETTMQMIVPAKGAPQP
jgi:hypothetical protein